MAQWSAAPFRQDSRPVTHIGGAIAFLWLSSSLPPPSQSSMASFPPPANICLFIGPPLTHAHAGNSFSCHHPQPPSPSHGGHPGRPKEVPSDTDLANQNSNSSHLRAVAEEGARDWSQPMTGKFSQSSDGSGGVSGYPVARGVPLKRSHPRAMRVRPWERRKPGGVFSPSSKLGPPLDFLAHGFLSC